MSIYIRRCGDPFHRYLSICIRSLGISPLLLDPLMIVVVDLDSIDRDDTPLPDNIVASNRPWFDLYLVICFNPNTRHPGISIANRPFHVAHVGLSRSFNVLYNSDDHAALGP
jgi:hypothetical protein